MHKLKDVLLSSDYELWTEYLKKQEFRLKKDSKVLLNQLISRLKKYTSIKLDQIVLEICDNRKSEDDRINHLLFREIILPNLLENYEKRNPDYFRLLVTFEQSIFSDNRQSKIISDRLNLTGKYFDSIEVLELELKLGENIAAAQLLINKIAQQLDYALHELPIGLLYETQLMESLLNRLTQLLIDFNLSTSKWESRVLFIKSAIDEWKIYLDSEEHPNFEEHLNASKSKESELVLSWNNSLLHNQ